MVDLGLPTIKVKMYKNPISGTQSNLVQTKDPSYYYGVWIKHISQFLNATDHRAPKVVAEIGPGAALGAGISAILMGSNEYYAFDLLKHTDAKENIRIMHELATMIKAKIPPKNIAGFPNYQHVLDKNGFPSRFFTDAKIEELVNDDRLSNIARALKGESSPLKIEYISPWEKTESYEHLLGKVDFIFSHSVMEHVQDIERAYGIMRKICTNTGGISHQIDFKSHGFTKPWNGYRTIDDIAWNKLTDGHPYSINREPPSKHIELINNCGFKILQLIPRGDQNTIDNSALIPRFQTLSKGDLSCSGLFVQAIKRDETHNQESQNQI